MSSPLSELPIKLNKAFTHLTHEFSMLRSGRASAQLLDPVSVEAYGTRMKLNEVANVSVPDATLIVIQPWDKSLLEAIEKAISAAGLNLHAIVDGQIIRVPVPALTAERRQEMVKLLHQKGETGRVMLRNIRSEVKQLIERQKGVAGVSEDDIEAQTEDLESEIKDSMERLEKMIKDKEKELTTI